MFEVTTSDGVATVTWSVYDADAAAIMQDSTFQQEFQQTLQEISGLDVLLGLPTYVYSFPHSAMSSDVAQYEAALVDAVMNQNFNEVRVVVGDDAVTWYIYDDNAAAIDTDAVRFDLQGIEGLREMFNLESVVFTLEITTGATVEELEVYGNEFLAAVQETTGVDLDRIDLDINGNVIWTVYDDAAIPIMTDTGYQQRILDRLCGEQRLAVTIEN